MRKKTTTKKQREQFYRRAITLFEELGVEKQDLQLGALASLYEWTLKTRVGTLGLSVELADHNTLLGQVFGRFNDPNRAKMITDCNVYSGKWNFHYFATENWTVESAIENLRYYLESVLELTKQINVV